jgi:putative glutamine amidotransferase
VTRPLIAIPARFSATASALRHGAELNARKLVEAVWRAGGEPATIHPAAPGGVADPAEVAARLARFDGVLLPGGGDLSPHRYGALETHPSVYDVDDVQDGFDLELARCVITAGMPLLAICRGLQTVNVALGGTLRQDMGEDHHRNRSHLVVADAGSVVERTAGTEKFQASCFHHQCVDIVAPGLAVTARAADGTVEALELAGSAGWLAAVQWHPEDTADQDPDQQAVFGAFVAAAREFTAAREPTAARRSAASLASAADHRHAPLTPATI